MCWRCQQKGHYKAYCFTKLEEILISEEVSLDSAFLDTVEDETNTSLIAQIKLKEQDTVYKLDTGEEVSTYQSLKRHCMDLHRLR